MNRNSVVGAIAGGTVVAMLGVSFASVPLYRLFCSVTGYDGTPQIGPEQSATVTDRPITVAMNAGVRARKAARDHEDRRGSIGLL